MDMSTEKQLDMLEDDQIKAEEPVLEEQEPEIALAAPEEEPKEELPLEAGIEELKAQLKRAEEARIEAERRAQEATERAARYSNDSEEAQLQVLTTAVDDLKRHQAILRQQKIEALAMGDYEKVADIDDQILEAKGNTRIIEDEIKARRSDPVKETIQQLVNAGAYRSAEWLQMHPDLRRNERKWQETLNAHNQVLAEGIPAETDEYFQRIEERLGLRRVVREMPQQESPMSAAAAPVARRSAPVAAPVSRGSSGMSKNAYRLTAAEKEAAAISGLTEEEYAAQKVRANGRMN